MHNELVHVLQKRRFHEKNKRRELPPDTEKERESNYLGKFTGISEDSEAWHNSHNGCSSYLRRHKGCPYAHSCICICNSHILSLPIFPSKVFKEHLRNICEAPVREHIGYIEVKGLHTLKIKQWLQHIGF
ncbi:mitochondrial large subunit ribosomal protein, putative [Plasmodium ovale wallikeri]|uniref:Mitochondrial large subunit ribosomal protein, putative n=1 Tax=Plasmodium ovale wallikeri TaxID=864142 RepID=A0A1A8YW35_PLAOA|nr:mitochondrial large subunit ribosomal protein, putative [Plasmodium ovale wallikeri]